MLDIIPTRIQVVQNRIGLLRKGFEEGGTSRFFAVPIQDVEHHNSAFRQTATIQCLLDFLNRVGVGITESEDRISEPGPEFRGHRWKLLVSLAYYHRVRPLIP